MFDINEIWCANTAPLTTPTYDGSGESTHPDLYAAGEGETWNGYRYWLAMTPYPNSNVELENPSILASNDLKTWVVPEGLTNPIDSPDAKHRSDPDLWMDGDTLYCYYRAMNGTDDIMWQKSGNGVTWGSKTIEIEAPHSTLSPALVKLGAEYQMYTIHYVGDSARVMQKRTASNIEGPWSAPVTVSEANPGGGNLWHLDMLDIDGTLVCLMCVNTTSSPGLYMGVSADGGDNWQFADQPFLAPRANLTTYWDHAEIYRSTAVKRDYGFDLIYAGHDNIGGVYEWRMALTKMVCFDPGAKQKHLYVYIANQTGLASYERQNILKIAGTPGKTQPLPNYKNHKRSMSSDAAIYEARLNSDYLDAHLMAEQLALVMAIDPGEISLTTSTESFGGGSSTKHVFKVGGLDKMTVIIFGTIGGAWQESHAECYGYLYG